MLGDVGRQLPWPSEDPASTDPIVLGERANIGFTHPADKQFAHGDQATRAFTLRQGTRAGKRRISRASDSRQCPSFATHASRQRLAMANRSTACLLTAEQSGHWRDSPIPGQDPDGNAVPDNAADAARRTAMAQSVRTWQMCHAQRTELTRTGASPARWSRQWPGPRERPTLPAKMANRSGLRVNLVQVFPPHPGPEQDALRLSLP